MLERRAAMKKRWTAIATGMASFATLVSAQAADLPPAPSYKAPMAVQQVYNWTGFYIGVNGGWGWALRIPSTSSRTDSTACPKAYPVEWPVGPSAPKSNRDTSCWASRRTSIGRISRVLGLSYQRLEACHSAAHSTLRQISIGKAPRGSGSGLPTTIGSSMAPGGWRCLGPRPHSRPRAAQQYVEAYSQTARPQIVSLVRRSGEVSNTDSLRT